MANAQQQYPTLGIQWCDTEEQLAQGTDALVLVTEWDQYRDLDWAQLKTVMRTPIILDGRLFLDRAKITEAGLQFISLI
jgi:UDPglucose 6-dehydrogenase